MDHETDASQSPLEWSAESTVRANLGLPSTNVAPARKLPPIKWKEYPQPSLSRREIREFRERQAFQQKIQTLWSAFEQGVEREETQEDKWKAKWAAAMQYWGATKPHSSK